jgi:hypothetical protein
MKQRARSAYGQRAFTLLSEIKRIAKRACSVITRQVFDVSNEVPFMKIAQLAALDAGLEGA